MRQSRVQERQVATQEARKRDFTRKWVPRGSPEGVLDIGPAASTPPRTPKKRRLAAESILMQLVACLQSGIETFKPFGLSSRDSLVQDFIRWGFEHGTSPATLDDICQQLYTSRRTLILGSKENFNCGPMELLRTIRLQQVHALLRSPTARSAAGLHQVSDVAEFCGFRSRGHFARAYQEHFEETPKATLMKSVA